MLTGHFVQGCLAWRVQEVAPNMTLQADIVKKIATDEELTIKQIYGHPVQTQFGKAMKTIELNPSNIPFVERPPAGESTDPTEPSKAVLRRLIVYVWGKATFVKNLEDVNEAEGKFLKLPKNQLEKILETDIIAGLNMSRLWLQFFKANTVEQCYRFLDDKKKLGGTIYEDTYWVAQKMCGLEGISAPNTMAEALRATDIDPEFTRIVEALHAQIRTKPGTTTVRVRNMMNLPALVDGEAHFIANPNSRLSSFNLNKARRNTKRGTKFTFPHSCVVLALFLFIM